MSRVILLPPEISQKIAAGEVIERPFSVVKELVENSLDAGASDVRVDLAEGGKKLVRVTDDGSGMSSEDVQVCFERHSTSKISTENDLGEIATLGFRGEALPSISAVSRLVLKTSEGTDEEGTFIEREGDKVLQIQDIGFPKGTMVEVKDLFFNLPPRRKFLRSERSELTAIVKYMTSVCLAYPRVKFSLTHRKRDIFNYPAVKSLKERIFQVYGSAILERLMELDYEEGNFRLHGFASSPPSGRSDRAHQLFYVNNRPVKDRLLQAALSQAYKGFLEKDRFPEAFLFIGCPYSMVDVNVHPTKAEVRFRESNAAFQLVVNGIRRAMLQHQGIKEIYPTATEELVFKIREKRPPPPIGRVEREREKIGGLFPTPSVDEEEHPRVLGQYLNLYIVAATEEGILIIDQHNAHERILFEKYKDINRNKEWPKRLPLFPLLMELAPSQIVSLEENKTLLEEAGFRVEEMGGQSFALKEFPDIFKEEDAKEIFLSLIEEMKTEKVEDRGEKLLATLACKTAVKAGEVLPLDKMNFLVEELLQTSNSSLCPHGRPIVVKIEKREIEKGLKRG